jgi:hypothetical protein
MAQIHMSEAEVSGDFAGALNKLGPDGEIVVDRNGQPVAIIKAPSEKTRTLDELTELARRREEQRGFPIRLDDDYAEDMEQVVRERKPWTPRPWE